MGFFSPSQDRNRNRQGGFFSRLQDTTSNISESIIDNVPGGSQVSSFFSRDDEEEQRRQSFQRQQQSPTQTGVNALESGVSRLPGGSSAMQFVQGAAEAATGVEQGQGSVDISRPQGPVEQTFRSAGRNPGSFFAGGARTLSDIYGQTIQDIHSDPVKPENQGALSRNFQQLQQDVTGNTDEEMRNLPGTDPLVSSGQVENVQEAVRDTLPEPREDAPWDERLAQGTGEFAAYFAPGLKGRKAVTSVPAVSRALRNRAANRGLTKLNFPGNNRMKGRLAALAREGGESLGFSSGSIQKQRANDEDVNIGRELALGTGLDLATLGAARGFRALGGGARRGATETVQQAFGDALDEGLSRIGRESTEGVQRNVMPEGSINFQDSRPQNISFPREVVSTDQASKQLQEAGYSKPESDNIISLTGRADDSGNVEASNVADNARRYSESTSEVRTQRAQEGQGGLRPAGGAPSGQTDNVISDTAQQLQTVADPNEAANIIRRSFPEFTDDITREIADFTSATDDFGQLDGALRIGKEEAATRQVDTPTAQTTGGPPDPGGVRPQSKPGDFGEPGFIGRRDIPGREDLSPTARLNIDRDVVEANKPLDEMVRERSSLVRQESQIAAEGAPNIRGDIQKINGRLKTDDPTLPDNFKSKNGRHPDEVAKQLNEEDGYMFEDGEDLVQSIKDNPTMTPKTHRESRLEAIRQLMRGSDAQAEEFQSIMNQLEEGINDFMRAEGIPEFSVDDFVVRRLIQEEQIPRSTAKGPKAGKTLEVENIETDEPTFGDEVYSTDSPFGERTINVKTTANSVMPKPQVAYLGGQRIKPAYIAVETADGSTQYKALKDSKSGFYGSGDIIRDAKAGKLRNKGSIMNSPLEAGVAQDGQQIGTITRDIAFPAQKAMASRHAANTELQTYVRDLADSYNIKTEDETVGNRLADLSEAITGRQAVTESTESIVERTGYTADEVNFIKEFRGVTDMLQETINEVRIAMGEDPIGYVENFYPHMVETSRWNRFIRQFGGVADSTDKEAPFELSFMTPDAQFNPSMQKRFGETTEYDKNFFKVMQDYIAGAVDEIHVRPAIANTKIQAEALREAGMGKAANYWTRYAREGLAGRQSAIDQSFSFMQRGGKTEIAFSKIQEIRVRGALQGNISWNMVTQPTSMFLTVKDAGYKKTARGAQKWLTDANYRDDIMKKAPSLIIKTKGGRSSRMSLQGISSDLDNKIQRTKLDKFDDFVNFLGDTEERHLTGASWAAGYEDALQRGYKGEDAEIYAEFVAQTTQGMYSRESRPLILNSQLIRTFMPFQTFTVYAFNHAKRMLSKEAGLTMRGARTYKNRVSQALTLMSAVYFANLYSEAVTGRKVTTPGSFVPFAGSAIDTTIGEAAGEYQPTQRAQIALLDDLRQLARVYDGVVNDGNFEELRKFVTFWGMGAAGIGGAGQVNKTIEGYSDYMDGESITPSGRQRFMIEQDLKNLLQAVTGGPYATEGGQQYVEENFPGASIFDIFGVDSNASQAEQPIGRPVDYIERRGNIGETPSPDSNSPLLRNNNQ